MTTILTRSARARGAVVLAGLLILAVSILWGLAIFVWSVLTGTGPAERGEPRSPVSPSITISGPASLGSPQRSALDVAKDSLAARPMLAVPASAAQPQPMVDATAGPAITLPPATDLSGPVSTGFPRTPQGAVAQLAAIDAHAFRDLNPTNPRQAYDWATRPGAVRFPDWSPQVGVHAILSGLREPDGSPELTSTWTPTHAQVKGVLDRGDFVLACVLGELDVRYRSTARAALGDCQRMVWHQGRWRIGPGAQPAFAPSTWPGSADCVRAGWREVRNA